MSSPTFSVYTSTPSTTTLLFTPNQRHHSPLSFYTPQTPSPLRTSRNANLMPPPPTPSAPTKSSPLASIENVWNTDENTFAFSPSLSTNIFAKESSFSRRSRSQSPITELRSRTSAARDRRKSLFLEQIRTRREDEKFEVRGEQVLRMDWAREEKERKDRLARQAMRLQMELDEDYMMLDERDGPSPTEDREIEELVALHEESKVQSQEEDMMGDLDDEDCDLLFMQAVNAIQEQQAGQQQERQQQGPGFGWPQQSSGPGSSPFDGGEVLEETMDMS